MGNHNRSRSPGWAGLLLMASTASALTLSNFQLITSSGVPIACILVYNTVIPGCTTDDFTQGTACSAGCANGLGRVQDRIMDVCDGVGAAAASVLGQALMGNLVDLLCPAAGTPGSSKQTTSTSALSTSSTSTSTTSTRASSSLSRSTLTTVTTAPSPPSTPTDTPPVFTSFVQSSPPTQTTEAQQTNGAAPTTEVPLGGGSPFDFVASSGSGQLTGGVSGILRTTCAVFVGLLLWY